MFVLTHFPGHKTYQLWNLFFFVELGSVFLVIIVPYGGDGWPR